MHITGKISGKICLKSIKDTFFPNMWSGIRRGTKELDFLIGAISSRRRKFKLISRYSMWEKSINYLISTRNWSLPNQNKSFISIQTSSYFFKHFTLLITSFLYKRCCFENIFFQKSKDSVQGVRHYWKVISYCQNLQKQPSAGAQKAFK